ncbi:hypothetical protein [Methyloversatilis discipulorum]|jgi:hypothetical protein|uniref:hypothetical protein n=1 Tax=Methyloversatilis discipulorum TaxID=1119528 RepID=UPI003F402799
MNVTTQRLKEGSTWAGLASLAMLFGASVEEASAVAQAVTAVAGLVAIFMPENKTNAQHRP